MSPLNVPAALSFCTALLSLFMALPMLALARRRSATGWLALLVLALGALSFCDSNLWRFQLFGLFDWPVAALGACYYCYVRSLTGLGNGWRQAMHFVPMLLAIPAFAWLRGLLMAVPQGADLPEVFGIGFQAVVFAAQGLAVAYMGGALWRLRQHRQRVRECYSVAGGRDMAWLGWLTVATLVLLLAWLPVSIFGGPWRAVLALGRLLLLVFIGWYGLRQAAVFVPSLGRATLIGQPSQAAPPAASQPVPADVGATLVETPSEPAKYARSGLNDAAIQLIAKRLECRMTESRDYLESDITLAQLAERIGASPQWLSQYLNDVLGLSFFDYINGLRVAEVQQSLRHPGNIGQPLLQLAFAAGFNSKSTFNAAFKRMTGSAPSAWRAAHTATSEPIR